MTSIPAKVHAIVPARCHWCGGPFVKVDGHFWCRNSVSCRERQRDFAIAVKMTDGRGGEKFVYLFVPLPRQVEFEECVAPNLMGGGGAGSTKSHIARWSLYRRALRIQDYAALILRRTWNELESTHFEAMEREARVFREHGYNVEFLKTDRKMIFYDTDAFIRGGHMENADDVNKYLSREYDDISADEAVTFEPEPLLELSTRARSSKPAVLEAGGARFRVYTNPGGLSASMLHDFFITKEPDWDNYSEALKELYIPEEWHYIPGSVEDNPYLPPNYQSRLAVVQPWRYRQLRYNDWDVVAGTFFAEFLKSYHVKDLGDPGEYVEWFRSLDWGYNKPGCVLWWALLPDGICYIRREYKFSHMLIETLVDRIHEIDRELGIRPACMLYTVADPALKSMNPSKANEEGILTGETMQETFSHAGMPILLGINDRHQGWQRVHEFLGSRGIMVDQFGQPVLNAKGEEQDLGPTVIIHPDCRYLTRVMAAAVSKKNDPDDLEHPDDHPVDSLRYGAMSRPKALRTGKIIPANSFMAHRKALIARRKRFAAR